MTELVICRGLPASGKTTWARAYVAEDPTTRARVNKDDLRRLVHDGVWLGRDTEDTINMLRDGAIRSLLRKGINVVNDDTNLPQSVARDLARVAREQGAQVSVQDFTNVPKEICLERDAVRENSVGAAVIEKMAAKIKGKKYPLPFPEDPEPVAAALETKRYVRSETLPIAWMVDIDGTLAHMEGRSPFEWHRVGEDLLNQSVASVVNALYAAHYYIIVMSGRDGVCRPETEEWLERHDISHHELIMRAEGDMRKDSIVKHELFYNNVAPRYAVEGVLDDRDQVVEMWREIGLPCFQVAPGSF